MSLRALLFLTVLFWGTTPVFEKLALRGGSPLVILFYRVIFIAVCVGGALVATGQGSHLVRLDGRTLLFTGLSALTGGVLGLTTYFHALQKGQASVVVPLISTYPVVTVLLSFVVLGEPITLTKAVGVGFIVAGVMLLR